MTLPRRWAGFTLAQRLLATLLLFFIAAATAFALLERAARETARAQQLLDIRAYFVARVAVMDEGWRQGAYSMGRQIELWRDTAVEVTPAAREARLRALVASWLDQGDSSHAVIVDAGGGVVFHHATRSQDAPSLPAIDARGLGWAYGGGDRTVYRAVSAALRYRDRPSMLVLYIPLDHALLRRLAYPATRLVLLQGQAVVATSEAALAGQPPAMATSPDHRATFTLPWDSASGAPVLRIERRFINPLSDAQLLVILGVCAASFAAAVWLVLGRWLRRQAQRLSALQRVASEYAAGPTTPPELERGLAQAAQPHDDIGILAGTLRDMMKRIGEAQFEQARVEQALATASNRLGAVIDSASDAVISIDRDGRIVLFNPAAERIFGHPRAAMLDGSLEMLLPTRAHARHDHDVAAFAASGETSRRMGTGRVRGRRADGAELDLEASISQVTVDSKQIMTAILRDVTERVRTERALMQYQLELTELTHQLIAQEKTTTSRLAQMLHDQLGQTLSAMRIDFVCDAALPDPAEAARHARVDKLIDQAVREVRQVLVELRPTLLDEHGLVEALDNELRIRRQAAGGVHLLLDAPPGLSGQRWRADVEYAAFMVAREAIANAQRHARATLVRVSLGGGPAALRLEIIDNGDGLAPDALAAKAGHLGMVGMRERAIAIGARLEVQAPPGGGTSVRLDWKDAEP